MADNLIEIDHVTFGYDASRTILDDVTLNFQRGKVTSLLGGSGCGKTTLLRLVGGVHAANRGQVRFDGQAVDTHDRVGLYKLRRRLGMLFQFGALFTDLSVFDNVAFPLREQTTLSEPMIRDIVLMKLNAVGLRGAAGLRIAEVSGGMARRIALARAVGQSNLAPVVRRRLDGGQRLALQHAAADAGARQRRGQCQASRAGADDDHVGGVRVVHRNRAFLGRAR